MKSSQIQTLFIAFIFSVGTAVHASSTSYQSPKTTVATTSSDGTTVTNPDPNADPYKGNPLMQSNYTIIQLAATPTPSVTPTPDNGMTGAAMAGMAAALGGLMGGGGGGKKGGGAGGGDAGGGAAGGAQTNQNNNAPASNPTTQSAPASAPGSQQDGSAGRSGAGDGGTQKSESKNDDPQDKSGGAGGSEKPGQMGEEETMKKLAEAAASGIGDSKDGPYCYRQVKKIIAEGTGKNLACVRGILSGGEAIDAMRDLPKAGFVNNMKECGTPGVIIVYEGKQGLCKGTSCRYGLAGDKAGHIEILGNDNKYHSFYASATPIDKGKLGKEGRRIRRGCFVPDPSGKAGGLDKCQSVASQLGSGKRSIRKGYKK